MITPFESKLTVENIVSILHSLLNWLLTHVFIIESIVQIFVIALCGLLGFLCANYLKKIFKSLVSINHKEIAYSVLSRLHLTFIQSIMLLSVPFFLWMATFIAAAMNWPYSIIDICAALITAWAIVRFFAGVIKNYFWSKLIAFIIWTLAALYLVGWLKPFLQFLDNASIKLGAYKISILSLSKCVFIVTALFWAADLLIRKADDILSDAESINEAQKNIIIGVIKFIFIVLAVTLGLKTLGFDLTVFAVFGGAIVLSIGVGLQKIFSNLISGIMLISDKTIRQGDLVVVGDTQGWVSRMGPRCVVVTSRDGKAHLIPNEILITTKVENWSLDYKHIRISIPIKVPLNSNLQLIKKMVLECAQERPELLNTPLPTCYIKTVHDKMVEMELVVWVNDLNNGLDSIKDSFYENILNQFQKNNIIKVE